MKHQGLVGIALLAALAAGCTAETSEVPASDEREESLQDSKEEIDAVVKTAQALESTTKAKTADKAAQAFDGYIRQ
jgi:hypothetical protein